MYGNMIKKFEEFINEIRFREVDDDGNDIHVEDRKENTISNNIKNLKPIDIGLDFYIADEDLVIDGQENFTWYEIQDLKKLFENSGWRTSDYYEFQHSFLVYHHHPPKLNKELTYQYTKTPSGEVLILKNIDENKYQDELEFDIGPFGESYYLDRETRDWKGDMCIFKTPEEKIDTCRVFHVNSEKFKYEGCPLETNNNDKTHKVRIRLVKDKK